MDSWGGGVTCNATGNFAVLEVARVLAKYRPELKRSVRLGWWSCHETGTMVGSSWFVNHYWDDLDRNGMVMDFVEAKRILGEAIEPFDHAYLNEVPPFDRRNPSCEHIARVIAEAVAARLPKGVRVASVTAWESDRCAATYSA